MRKSVVLLTASVAACASAATIRSLNPISMDMPEREGVEVRYKNSTKHTLCLSPSEWPNAGGKMNHASNRVALVIGDRRYAIVDFNTGYCFGGCPTHVRSGEEITAFIPYREFRLPDELRNQPKKLEFSPAAYRCKAPRQ